MRARPLTDEEFPSENARNNRRRSEFACVGASGGGDDMYQTEYTRAFGINHDRANRVVEENSRMAAAHSPRDSSERYHAYPGVDHYNSDDEWDEPIRAAHNKQPASIAAPDTARAALSSASGATGSDAVSGAGAADNRRVYPDDASFVEGLRNTYGWLVEPMLEDGACMFRAVAYHVFGDQEMHGQVRDQCMEYMLKNRDHFAEFVTEDFDAYIVRKSHDRCFGNHLELQAMSELYNRSIEVYSYSPVPINTFQSSADSSVPMRLSYHNSIHYNAVYDPQRPTFGVGLGFAELRPGDADRRQVAEATAQSEQSLVEQAIVASSLRDSEDDWQRQEAALMRQVMEQSQREYFSAQTWGTGSAAGSKD